MTGHPARRAELLTPAGLRGGPIYLDYNATTPVDPRVVEAMLPYLTTHFGNPSSGHHYAEQPRRALATARQQVARLIGAAPDEIVFTGSGSEADALAIHGTVMAHRRPSGVQVITQVTEHPAVLEACRALHRRHGTEVTYLPVGPDGRVKPQDLAEAITPRTALVSIMAANNETGVLQPIDELARITCRRGALFHTDAAQAVGRDPDQRGAPRRRPAHCGRPQAVRAQGRGCSLRSLRGAPGSRMTFRSHVGSVAADRPLYADTSSSAGRARSGARCGKDG